MKPLALVTGASSGIGRAIASHLAASGHDIIVVARNQERLDALARQLASDFGTNVRTISIDLDDFAASGAAVAAALESAGRLDVLVHSAGIFRFGTAEMALSDLQALLSTNVMAVHNLTQVALPYLRKAGRAHLFAIASITGVEPFAPVGGYATSKHALVGYIRSVARQEVRNGIRATAICPDVVDTDMSALSGMAPEDMIHPDDVAKTVLHIMSLSPAVTLEQITLGCSPSEGSLRAAA